MKVIKPIKDEHANLLTIRDPMILPVEDTYYLIGTQPPYWEGINDGVHMWSSKDLEHFTYHGLIVKREDIPEDMWCKDRFWAPEVFDGKDGYFYVTFNCKNESEQYAHDFGVGVARAKNITGPYEILTVNEPASSPMEPCIDGTFFRDDDGTLWLGFNYSGEFDDCIMKLMLGKFDPETGKVYDVQTVATNGKEGEWDSIGVEGQCIVKRNGIYYQWYSSWTHGYNAGILTAESMNGPWKKCPLNPILGDNESWVRAGHNHSFRGFDGQDYIVFHANPKNPEDGTRESMYIVPVEYKEDGTVEIELND